MTDKKIDSYSAQVEEMRSRWKLVDALMNGTEEIRRQSSQFLPRIIRESDEDYRARVNQSFLFPAFATTINTFASKPFAERIDFEHLNEKIKSLVGNIDGNGESFYGMLRQVFVDALVHGVSYIYIDYPRNTARNKREEKSMGLRPYWHHVPARNILGWRTENKNNKTKLSRVRIKEAIYADDNFGWDDDVLTTQIRVLYQNKSEVWRQNKDGEWGLVESTPVTLGEIPLIPVYTHKTGFMTGLPPLQDLAQLNLAHFQSSSVQRSLLNIVRIPFLFGKAWTDFQSGEAEPQENIEIGAKSLLNVPGAQADLRYVEHSGRSLESGEKDIDKLQSQMAAIGTQKLIKPDVQSINKTATESSIENNMSESELGGWVLRFNDAINECIRVTGLWMKIDEPGSITISRNWQIHELSVTKLQILDSARARGDISNETYLRILKQFNAIPEEMDAAREAIRAKQERDEFVGIVDFDDEQEIKGGAEQAI